jgi:ankyrin repeat protein
MWLIGEGKASVDQADNHGTTPLYTAVTYGDVDMVRWLIREGKASVN